jgi:tripartite-type tricarboxylate transporter receptor subunit TctC
MSGIIRNAARPGRRRLFGLAAGLGTAAITRAAAQPAWPQRSVRLVVPFTPAGPTDIQARVIAEKLAVRWGQPVVVENRVGGGSTIGSNIVARAAPDGYTLLLQGSAHVTNAALFPNLPYHPVTDFSPIMGISFQPVILTVHPSVPARSVAEYVALARERPDTITAGVAGVGNISHLAGVLLEQQAGIKLVTVPFGGSSAAQTALLGGQIHSSFLNSTVATPFIRDGSLRGLGSTSSGRWRELPDLPTVAEQGYPGFECTSWYAFLAPARTPDAVVRKVYEDTRAVLQMQDVKDRLFSAGLDLLDQPPEEIHRVMVVDYEKWGDVIRKAGLRL